MMGATAVAKQTATLPPVRLEALEFPPPPCPYCGIDCEVEDGFRCPACSASWPLELAHLYQGERPCVECDQVAEVTGGDEQPRCRGCAERVASHPHEAAGPYICLDCGARVIGIGRHRVAYEQHRCGRCFEAAEQRVLATRVKARGRRA